MRPVTKKVWTDDTGQPIDKQYHPYQKAKDDLIDNIGKYCSFCEVPVPPKSSLEVEHIRPKSLDKYQHLSESWSNFLLGCKNCNPIKGAKDFEFDQIHLPHLNNTLLSFQIREGGLLEVSANITPDEKAKAQKMIWLVGIDRRPGQAEYSSKDDRWKNRLEAWNLAKKYHQKYQSLTVDVDTIADLALNIGFFMVWITVFENSTEVRQALIDRFRGTAKDCFDDTTQPIRRNGALI
jgi:uncharacterized protein (TIGR02646 family)